MQKTKIEWTDYVWNPIKGFCPNDCWYCYAKRIYQRFRWDPKIRYELDDLRIIHDLKGKEYSKIFVCSTFELFHPITNTLLFPLTEGSDMTYRDMIFSIIKDNPQHTFQILTKFPQNIDREMPDNVWLGTTVTNQIDLSRITHIELIKAKKRFVSFEPLLGYINWEGFRLEFSSLDWIIVGQLTGHGKKYNPQKYWINQIKFYAGYYGIPLFMKNNLKEIWGEPLIQEFPG